MVVWMAAVLVSVAGPAFADNDALVNAYNAHLGELVIDNSAASNVQYYKVDLTAGRSYAAYCWVPSVDGGSTCQVDWRNGSDVTPAGSLGAVDSEPYTPGMDVDTFIPTASSLHWVRVNTGTASQAFHLMIVETTLFSPWYFRSAPSGYEGFIEVKNTTNVAVSVTITAHSNTGTVAGTPMTTSIQANGNLLVPAGASVASGGLGVPDSYGSVSIAHLGMPGAIVANITTLSAATGLSFDAPFTARMKAWPVSGP
jgi:hypothetical protein